VTCLRLERKREVIVRHRKNDFVREWIDVAFAEQEENGDGRFLAPRFADGLVEARGYVLAARTD
jgi:hypothetical protein